MAETNTEWMLEPREFLEAVCSAMGVDSKTVAGVEISASWGSAVVNVTFTHFGKKELLNMVRNNDGVQRDYTASGLGKL